MIIPSRESKGICGPSNKLNKAKTVSPTVQALYVTESVAETNHLKREIQSRAQ
jgi:hypothetical protein